MAFSVPANLCCGSRGLGPGEDVGRLGLSAQNTLDQATFHQALLRQRIERARGAREGPNPNVSRASWIHISGGRAVALGMETGLRPSGYQSGPHGLAPAIGESDRHLAEGSGPCSQEVPSQARIEPIFADGDGAITRSPDQFFLATPTAGAPNRKRENTETSPMDFPSVGLRPTLPPASHFLSGGSLRCRTILARAAALPPVDP